MFIASPVLLMIAMLLVLCDGAPPLYWQRRLGLGGKEFLCLKFRTMALNGDEILARHLAANPLAARQWAELRKLDVDPRVSKFGAFLRRTSLDELPQIVNVARGEMSFVGPRPIVRAEIDKYGANFRHYCRVRPGMTGLWQVSGRSDTSYARRVKLDVAYVRRRSLALNLQILLRTVFVVLSCRGSR